MAPFIPHLLHRHNFHPIFCHSLRESFLLLSFLSFRPREGIFPLFRRSTHDRFADNNQIHECEKPTSRPGGFKLKPICRHAKRIDCSNSATVDLWSCRGISEGRYQANQNQVCYLLLTSRHCRCHRPLPPLRCAAIASRCCCRSPSFFLLLQDGRMSPRAILATARSLTHSLLYPPFDRSEPIAEAKEASKPVPAPYPARGQYTQRVASS